MPRPGPRRPIKNVRMSQPDWDFITNVALRFETTASELIRYASTKFADEINDTPNGKIADDFVLALRSAKKEKK